MVTYQTLGKSTSRRYLRMETCSSDWADLTTAAKNLALHAAQLGSLGFGTSFLEWVASFAAIYLLILHRTNWKTNILTGLLIPYIFFSLPSLIFNIFRWVAFIAVILRLFFPTRFPEWLQLPAALILLIVKYHQAYSLARSEGTGCHMFNVRLDEVSNPGDHGGTG
ncbi:hypothetical protein QQ045_020834 [Rhodiola kirilowii]